MRMPPGLVAALWGYMGTMGNIFLGYVGIMGNMSGLYRDYGEYILGLYRDYREYSAVNGGFGLQKGVVLERKSARTE